MMSYEDGWQDSPYGNAPTNVGYGYLGGLMAFDIAAIQDKYGVNEDYQTGNNTYILKDVNAAGTLLQLHLGRRRQRHDRLCRRPQRQYRPARRDPAI